MSKERINIKKLKSEGREEDMLSIKIRRDQVMKLALGMQLKNLRRVLLARKQEHLQLMRSPYFGGLATTEASGSQSTQDRSLV
jgi:hypothetical protein